MAAGGGAGAGSSSDRWAPFGALSGTGLAGERVVGMDRFNRDSRPASRLSEVSLTTRDEQGSSNVRKLWRGGGESALSLLCAFDIWLHVLWLYVVVLAIVCVPGIQELWSQPPPHVDNDGIANAGIANNAAALLGGHAVDAASRWSAAALAALAPPSTPAPPPYVRDMTFEVLFGLLFCGAVALATIALLALFFLREWALVLFLWKLFELGCLLLLLLSYTFTHAIPQLPPNAIATEIPLLVAIALYALYTMLMLRQLWQVP